MNVQNKSNFKCLPIDWSYVNMSSGSKKLSCSPQKKDDLISSLVYNIFIAPVYAIFAAFASLALLNAIIFLGNFSLCKMLIFLCPWMSPISLIFIFTSMNAYFLYRLSSRLCRLSLCSTVAAVSICFDLISLYYANLSPEWTISLGTLLGINLHVISKETLLDELLKESFDRVTTLRN